MQCSLSKPQDITLCITELMANARLAAADVKFSPISHNSSYVKATKWTFTLNGKPFYPAGTNW